MVNGPGSVTLTARSVLALRNSRSATWIGARAPHRADDARDRDRVAAAVQRRPRVVEVDPGERRGEAVGIALAADLAVGDDVQARQLLVADGDERGVVLGLLQVLRVDAPQLARTHARGNATGERLAVDEPVGLRVGEPEPAAVAWLRLGCRCRLIRVSALPRVPVICWTRPR
jgi:hypothetical protein